MRSLGIFFVILFLNSCATVEALKSPSSDYRSFVDRTLAKSGLYDAGRQMVVIKALPANQKLKILQESLTPGFGFDKKEEVYQVIAALSLSHPGGFTKSDIKMSLNDFEVLHVKEITGSALLETLYDFAYPYQRVFLLDFSKDVESASPKKLKMRTPRGEVNVLLNENND